MTALVIYKQGYMNVQEIANVMDLFYKFTMKVELEDGVVGPVVGVENHWSSSFSFFVPFPFLFYDRPSSA